MAPSCLTLAVVSVAVIERGEILGQGPPAWPCSSPTPQAKFTAQRHAKPHMTIHIQRRTCRFRRRYLCLLFACAGAAAQAPSPERAPHPQKVIRFDEPETGTRIRSIAVWSTRLPLNLSYEQLSPEDRALFHRHYEAMPPGDEPPYPLSGIRALIDPVRSAQQRRLAVGELLLIATVDPQGVVTEVQIVGEADPTMAKVAARALAVAKFKPAVCSGQPCIGQFPLSLSFAVQ